MYLHPFVYSGLLGDVSGVFIGGLLTLEELFILYL